MSGKILWDLQVSMDRRVLTNQGDIVVVQQGTEGDSGDGHSSFKSQQHQEEGVGEAGKLPGTERGTGKDMESEEESDPSGSRSTQGCDS